MTEHEASAVAEEAAVLDRAAHSATTGMEAEPNQPSSDAAPAPAQNDVPSDAASSETPAPKRRRKQAEEHPSLFSINLNDPELPSHTMPFMLRVEAAILLADRPISDGRIAEVLGLVPPSQRGAKDTEAAGGEDEASPRDSAALNARRREAARLVAEAVDQLNAQYAETNRAFRIESVSGGRQMLTIAVYGPVLTRMKGARAQARLSQPALETLAIIAYRQPILRAQLEAIRGVACGEVLKSLIDRRLVKITGRAEEVGRPMLYGTTPEFLRVFGISSLSDLPQAKDLK
jgi:segregation and condensation protein B